MKKHFTVRLEQCVIDELREQVLAHQREIPQLTLGQYVEDAITEALKRSKANNYQPSRIRVGLRPGRPIGPGVE